VTLAEIESEAIAPAERVRVDLVCKLLDTLPPLGTDVSDEEVAKRECELDNGEVEELPHDEFARTVENERIQNSPTVRDSATSAFRNS